MRSLLYLAGIFLVPTFASAAIVLDVATGGDGINTSGSAAAHTCAVLSGGELRCWGANAAGQLGDGSTVDRRTPVEVTGLGSGVVKVTAGASHTCALTSGGAVMCWGGNDRGQLGDGTTTTRLTPVTATGLTSGVTAITAGNKHTCALLSGGGMKCWGANTNGQIGDGTTTNRLTPTDVSGLSTGVLAISAGGEGINVGGSHTCAVTSGGGVKCWGANSDGQLGDGTRTQRLTPVDVSGLSSGATAVSAGGGHTCALTSAGAVRCWGDDDFWQIGDGSTPSDPLTPTAVTGLASGVAAIEAGQGHTCAVTTGGGAKCWGFSPGALGDGTGSIGFTPVDVLGFTSGVASVSAAASHACLLTTTGDVKCWGSNGRGQRGDGTAIDMAADDVSGLTSGVTAIAVNQGSTCAVTSAGYAKCWGHNSIGALGDGTHLQRLTPTDVSGLAPGASAITLGSDYGCAVTSGGGAKCWGQNSPYGNLGDGTKTNRNTPVDVIGLTSGVAAVAAGGPYGDDHTCALTTGGGVKCWGANFWGQLGDGTTTERLTPVNVVGLTSGMAAIAVGPSHSCALGADGGVRCWGRNSNGQLGNGTTADALTPVSVVGLASGVAGIAAGLDYTCAVTVAGAVKCWGDNFAGKIGGAASEYLTPVDVVGLGGGVSSVAAGAFHTCAVLSAGGIKCWGLNDQGQLGDGTTTNSATPRDVLDPTSAVAVAVSLEHTCAITGSGGAKCWGRNETGQFGNGEAEKIYAPATSVVALDCGNGSVDAGESCDDGNTTGGDCCSATCQYEVGPQSGCTDGVACTADVCNGAGACVSTPDDAACDDGDVCSAETCSPTLGCQYVAVNGGVTCRPAAGSCDVPETCTGISVSCPTDVLVDAGTTCRASAGGCDVPESCTGSAADCPADAVLGAGTSCRVSAGACDVAETCDGVGNQCPADGLAAAGTVCRASAGACDAPESCTGFTVVCPGDSVLPAGTTCRASAGPCDVVETCDGVGTSCPADGFVTAGTECRSMAGPCDLAEVCTGSSAACPADAKSTAICRSAAGVCDVAESCDGVDDECPADGFVASGTTCRSSAADCDLAEACTGSSASCPPDSLAPAGTTCRPSSGACDVAETCTGAASSCPGDGFAPAGTVCRGSLGVCDVTETCDGAGSACPADGKSTSVCRAAAGPCDVAELCDGIGNDCPVDAFETGGTVCRAAADACDAAEVCSGSAAACPTDGRYPDGDGDGTCDAEDNCAAIANPGQEDQDADGAGDACDDCLTVYNPDQRDSDGVSGGDLCDVCPSDATNTCDVAASAAATIGSGGGTLATADASVTLTLPPLVVAGDTSVSVTGGLSGSEYGVGDAGTLVLVAKLEPDGASFTTPVTAVFAWNDADDDGIVDGVGVPEGELRMWRNGVASTGRCDDPSYLAPACTTACCDPIANTWTLALTSFSEYAMTNQVCAPMPRNGCARPTLPGKSRLSMKADALGPRDKLSWTWSKGEEVAFENLGTPTTSAGDVYALCMYAGGSQTVVRQIAVAGGTSCATKPCWKQLGTAGYGYRNARAIGSLSKLQLKSGPTGKAKVVAKGTGDGLLPPLPLALPVRVQLQALTGQCWDATYGAVRKNDGVSFLAGSD